MYVQYIVYYQLRSDISLNQVKYHIFEAYTFMEIIQLRDNLNVKEREREEQKYIHNNQFNIRFTHLTKRRTKLLDVLFVQGSTFNTKHIQGRIKRNMH